MKFPANGAWRPGHFERALPSGYKVSVLDMNLIRNPALSELWELLKKVTRGPLFSRSRWKAIVLLHTGYGRRLMDQYCLTSYFLYKEHELARLRRTGERFISMYPLPRAQYGRRRLPLSKHGIGLKLEYPVAKTYSGVFSVGVSSGQKYETVLIRRDKIIHRFSWQAPRLKKDEIYNFEERIPQKWMNHGFDVIKVVPKSSNAYLSHFVFWRKTKRLPFEALQQRRTRGEKSRSYGVQWMGEERGLFVWEVHIPFMVHVRELDLSLDSDDDVRVVFWSGERRIGQLEVRARPLPKLDVHAKRFHKSSLQLYRAKIPLRVQKQGFDRVEIRPTRGDGRYALGHLLFQPTPPASRPASAQVPSSRAFPVSRQSLPTTTKPLQR
ncbi:MAG: hypothetical protein AAGJ35_05505, partial [Myxococcota bacterium]